MESLQSKTILKLKTMKQNNNIFEFNGDRYKIVSVFGTTINARKTKTSGRVKMYQPCEAFNLDPATNIITKINFSFR